MLISSHCGEPEVGAHCQQPNTLWLTTLLPSQSCYNVISPTIWTACTYNAAFHIRKIYTHAHTHTKGHLSCGAAQEVAHGR